MGGGQAEEEREGKGGRGGREGGGEGLKENNPGPTLGGLVDKEGARLLWRGMGE